MIPMFVCPVCGKQFKTETAVAKCFLACWKEQNPNYKSKEAPHSDDIVVRQDEFGAKSFFENFLKGKS